MPVRTRPGTFALSRSTLAFVGVVAVSIVLALPVLNEPFGRDQGIFATIADRMRQGGMPYRDAWDHKPPGVDAVYALAFTLFGRTWTAIHLFDLITSLAAMTAIWAWLRHYSAAVGVAAAAALGLGRVFGFEWWDRGQAEMTILGLSTVGLLAMRGVPVVAFLGGIALGTLAWFKPTAVAFTGFGLLLAVLPSDRVRRLPVVIAGMAVGGLLPLLPFVLSGTVNDMWTAVVIFNQLHLQTGANFTLDAAAWGTFDYFGRMGPVSVLALIGAVAAWRTRRSTVLISIGWLLAALVGVWAQGKFFSYHWSPALPPLAVLAGFGLVAIWREGRSFPIWQQAIGGVVAIALLIPFARQASGPYLRDVSYAAGAVSQDTFHAQFGHNLNGTDVYSFLAARQTAEYLRQQTSAQDTVLLWGFQPLVNWLADRPAPTRFIFSYPLTIERPDSPIRRDFRQIFLTEIDKSRPKFIVLVSNDINPIQTADSVTLLNSFPAFKEQIDRDYALDRDIADFHIYRRK